MKHIIYGSAILCASLLSGCMTTTQQQSQMNRNAARQREDMRQTQERINRVGGDLQSLQSEINRLNSEVARLQELRANDVANNESQIQQLQARQAQDKQEIIAALSRQIETLLKSQPAPSSQSSSGSDYGIEHVVRGGETLSAIAKAYGVTPTTIIKSNNLKNPNRLIVGQKLFIPQ